MHLTGALREGVTATDLALTVTQMLRKAKVVGKFVEFFGPGAAALPVVDRATIANMAPEYGATMGFFPIDDECVNYLRATGRSEEHCRIYENYYKAQGLWGIPKKGDIAYSQELELDLGTVLPSVAGPKRPQDRIELPKLKERICHAFSQAGHRKWLRHEGREFRVRHAPQAADHTGAQPAEFRSDTSRNGQRPHADPSRQAWTDGNRNGSVLIAAITSCTNTSIPASCSPPGCWRRKPSNAARPSIRPSRRRSRPARAWSAII